MLQPESNSILHLMDQPLVVREVALRADDTVLELLSRVPSLWSHVKPLLQDQFWWYQRTSEAFNLPDHLEWSKQANSKANWHKIYNILIATREGNPFDDERAPVLYSGRQPLWLSGQSKPVERSPDKINALEKNKYNLTAVKLLLAWGYKATSYSIRSAARYGSLEVLLLLLGDREIDDDILSELMNAAASGGQLATLNFLLEHEAAQEILEEDGDDILVEAFETAVLSSHVAAAELISSEMGKRDVYIYESDLDSQRELTSEAIDKSSPEMIQYLSDSGMIYGIDSDWIELSIDRGNAEVFLVLTGLESPFEYVNPDKLNYIGEYVLDRSRGPIRSASQLSGVSEEDILDMLISGTSVNFYKNHFIMLLARVVIAQADLDYYITWLGRMIKPGNQRAGIFLRFDKRVTELFVRCIDSISTPRVVHTSAYFTAYSAFFLLANSPTRDVQAVLRTIESEQGVTKEGLLKARILLGAFEGRQK